MAEPGEILPERKIDNSVYDLLKKRKLSVEEIVAKMLAIKKDGHSKYNLRELVTHMFLNFVSLRQVSLFHAHTHTHTNLLFFNPEI